MIQYFDDGDVACFNGRTFRRDKKTGYYLASQKPRKRLHICVWEYYNGEIPKGYQIHHIDMDKRNNDISNLQMMTRQEHMKYHGENMREETKEKLRKNLIENAIPKSKEWHRSEDGRKWHSDHGKKAYEKRGLNKYCCTYCGKEFETRHIYGEGINTFCSNNCKSAYRRKMGFDDVTKICECCGKEFIENKYHKNKKCKDCRGKNNRKRK